MTETPLYTVVETPNFIADLKALRFTPAQSKALVDWFAANPNAGDLIRDTGGARKVRYATKGRGKRGGCRVISFYDNAQYPVYLLVAYGKNEKANLTAAEKKALKQILTAIKDAHRRRS